MPTRLLTIVAAAVIVLLACASTANAIQDAPPNPDAPIVADFLDRVKRYAALHNKL